MKKIIISIFIVIFLAQLIGAIWFFLRATKVINTQGVVIGQLVGYVNASIEAELLPSLEEVQESLKPKPVAPVTEEAE